MSLLLNVIYAAHARSTHHKLALDALRRVEGDQSVRWTNLILTHHAAYLEGAKAPDDDFKDFKNHVLHVQENFWGGAVASVHHWYGQLIDHLRGEEWRDAAYAAGVLSHYFSDPHMPFHTGQSESEGAVHRAAEWSVTKSYEQLRLLIEQDLGGYPQLAFPQTADWLGDLLRAGATFANSYYESLIDHYNLELGVRDPPAGLDLFARKAVARCLAQAIVGFSMILERAFEESLVAPPDVTTTLPSILATVKAPVRQIINKLTDIRERKEVEAILREVQESGKAVHSLPESERLVRQFHATEVRKVPLSVLNREQARPAGKKYVPLVPEVPSSPGSAESPVAKPALNQTQPQTMPKVTASEPSDSMAGTLNSAAAMVGSSTVVPADVERKPAAIPLPGMVPNANAEASAPGGGASVTPRRQRYFLHAEAPIVDAPSIGPKTAVRFREAGLTTIDDLLKADPSSLASRLAVRHITPDVIRDWQAQASLMISVAGLRGHDAQMLVAAEIRDRSALREASADELCRQMQAIAGTSQGRTILRDSPVPDLAEITGWLTEARRTQETVLPRAS